jgi:hypothetical protein
MANHDSVQPHAENPAVHHETSDVNIRAILGFGAGLLLIAVAIHVAIWLLFGYFEGREAQHVQVDYPLAIGEGNRLPPEPRLQINPREDLRDLRAKEDAILESYGWVDRNAGVVRIPIAEAMKLTVQRGLPARQGTGK